VRRQYAESDNYSAGAADAKGASTTKETKRIGNVCEVAARNYARLLRAIAAKVGEARLSTGARVLDAIDFKEWLIELAGKAEQAETLEQFLSQA